MIGRADYDSVHFALHFFEHHAIVDKSFGVRTRVFAGVAETVLAAVDVAVRYDFLFEPVYEPRHISAAHQPRADEPEPYGSFVELGVLGVILRVQIARNIGECHCGTAHCSDFLYKTSSVFHIFFPRRKLFRPPL